MRQQCPFQRGALTITRMMGETVAFTAADGGTGTFDYVTGQFR